MSDVRLLTRADIPAAMRLKEAAGWNQTEHDWAALLEIEPEGCFGIDCGGALAATTTAVRYGRELAWIGMVLTAPEHRGKGLARRLMEHALAWLNDVACVKLDATDMGRPLYSKLGFVDECAVERWGHAKAATGNSVHAQTTLGTEKPVTVFADRELDREAFGADRSAVLDRIAVESAVLDNGYALGRPGSRAAYFGPCVARDAATAARLLDWFLALHAGEPVYWDLLASNPEAALLAQSRGFRRLRSLVRMVRPAGAPLAHNDGLAWAIAGFEYG